MLSPQQLLRLAQHASACTGKTLWRLGEDAAGNPSLFRRLAAGKGCHSSTIEQAEAWFSVNWPRGVPWPADVPDLAPFRSASSPPADSTATDSPGDPHNRPRQAA